MNRRNLIAGIWLIGLGILFLFNYVWPGVIILAGLTMIVMALVPPERREMPPVAPPPTSVSVEAPPPVQETREEPLPPVLAEKADLVYKQSLLPETCPACGGPVKQNTNAVVWQDENTAECPFCAYKIKIAATPAA